MLRRTTLATAIACLLAAAPGQAEIRLSANGLGDALYVPHFTVEDDRASLLTLINHAATPTSARIVISESLNGQATLYFDAFLPAFGTWTAALLQSESGAARLSTASELCTVPTIPPGGVDLRNFDYASNFPDGGPSGLERTRQGAIEVIERGVLSGQLATFTNERNCGALLNAYSQSSATPFDRSGQVAAPSSLLEAHVQVVDVAQGLVFPVQGVAVQGHGTEARDRELNDLPIERFSNPTLAAGEDEFVVATAAGRLAFAADRGPDAISSLFMSQRLSGEVLGDAEIGASTEWVVSFPTKHAYVARFGDTLVETAAVAPFSQLFAADGACETLSREQRGFSGQSLASDTLDLCHENATIDFAAGRSGIDVLELADDPQRRIEARALDGDGGTVVLQGLPLIGLRLSHFVNGQATPGVLANYTVALPLRTVPASASSE